MFRRDDRGFGRDEDFEYGRVEPDLSRRAPEEHDPFGETMHAPRSYQHPGKDDHLGMAQYATGRYLQPYDDEDLGWQDEDSEFDCAAGVAPTPRRWATVGNGIAALGSVALLVSVGVWGFDLVMRDVSGVPVVRALDEPMRKAPTEHGGQLAAHQGLTVNDVAAVGVAAGPAEQVVLAPGPVELAAEDTATRLVPLPEALVPDTQNVALDSAAQLTAQTTAQAAPASQLEAVLAPATLSQDGVIAASSSGDGLPKVTSIEKIQLAQANGTPLDLNTMADRIAAGTLVPTAPTSQIATDGTAPGQLTVPVAVQTTAALSNSTASAAPVLRPRLRPAGLRPALAAPRQPVAVAAAAPSADLDSAIRATLVSAPVTQNVMVQTSQGRMVQLGAVSTSAQADQEWARLSAILGGAMTRHDKITQQATSGGRQIYRLRLAGFANGDAASRFCATVRARGPDCIVVPR